MVTLLPITTRGILFILFSVVISLAVNQFFGHVSLKLLPFLLPTPMALLLIDRLAVIHVRCVALGMGMTNILVFIPALIGVLSRALLYVLSLALLMVLIRALLGVLSLTLRVVLGLALPLVTLLALRGVLGVTLVLVLVLAMLLISCGTVWLVVFLPYHFTLIFSLQEFLQLLQDSSRGQPQGGQQ